MGIFQPTGTSKRIKANRARLVKSCVLHFVAACSLLAPGFASAEDPVPPPPPSNQEASPTPAPAPQSDSAEAAPENLPDIEAKQFSVRVNDRTRSYRTYLLDVGAEPGKDPLPPEGRILMIREGDENAMGLRILKVYPDTRQIAAVRLKVYNNYRVLDLGEKYTAIQKLNDLAGSSRSEAEQSQDRADLKELEGKASSDARPAHSRPAGAAPTGAEESSEPKKSAPEAEELDPSDEHLGLSIDETYRLDPYRHWLTATIGLLLNNDIGSGPYQKGGGLRYGLDLLKEVILKKTHAQDSLTAEAGVYLYKIVNPDLGDSYTVMPISAGVRYNVFFSEAFALFADVTLMQNIVVGIAAGNNAQFKNTAAFLSSTVLGAGVGGILRVGPNWDMRLDAGLDFLGLGLVLRF